jgi:hypothetical protein
MHPFRVAINAKGGDCWHVYRQSVLFIDGNNNNEDIEEKSREAQEEKRIVCRDEKAQKR